MKLFYRMRRREPTRGDIGPDMPLVAWAKKWSKPRSTAYYWAVKGHLGDYKLDGSDVRVRRDARPPRLARGNPQIKSLAARTASKRARKKRR